MRYIKQILFFLFLLSLLICFFAFGVSAVESESVLSVDVDGVSFDFSLPSDSTWRNLINSDSFYYANGYGVAWTTDGYDNIIMQVVDGNKSYKYRLVDSSGSSVTGFVTVYNSVFSSVPYSAAEIVERKISILVNYSRSFSFTIEDGWFWGDLCEDGVSSSVDIQCRDYGTVYLVFDNLYALRIRNAAGTYVSISDQIVDLTYFCDLPEFIFNVQLSGETYALRGEPVRLLFSELIGYDTIFNSEDLGYCKFVYLDEAQKVVALRVGVQADGTYSAEYLLEDDRGDPCFSPDSLLYESSQYLLLTPCTELHAVGNFIRVKDPTCVESGTENGSCLLCGEFCLKEVPATGYHVYGLPENYIEPGCEAVGSSVKQCSVCGHLVFAEIPELGHDLDFFKNCTRCDYSENSLSDIYSGIRDWFNGNGDSSSGDGKKNLWDQIKEFLTDDSEGIHTTFDGLAKILSLGLVLVLVLIFYPLLKPLFELLGNLISNGVQAIRAGSKSLSKKVKNYKKKVTNKK